MAEHDQIEQWVAEACGGDRLALAKLLAVYHPQLQARAMSRMDPALRGRGSPDDVLQDVYVDVTRQIDGFQNRGPGSFLAWVCAILDHKLIDTLRAAHYQVRDVHREVAGVASAGGSYWDLLNAVVMESGTPSRAARQDEALAALHASLSTLSEAHRQVLEWRFLEGLPVGEVARRLGKSEGAVVALTKRALEALRLAMDGRGEFTHGA